MCNGSFLFTSLPVFIYFCLFVDSGHSSWAEREPHCYFDLHFSAGYIYWVSFIYSLTIWISSLEKYIFRSFAHFNWFTFVIKILSSLYILDIYLLFPLWMDFFLSSVSYWWLVVYRKIVDLYVLLFYILCLC